MAGVDLPRARAELDAALAIAERIDDASAIVEIRGWLAAVADMSGDPDEAGAQVERGLAFAARAPDGVPFARLLNLRGILAMWAGRLDASAESMVEAERRGRLAGGVKLASSAAGNLVVVHRRRGMVGQALAAAMRSLGLKRALGDRTGALSTFINLCDVYAELGELGLAEAAARRGIAGGTALGHRRIWAQGLLSLAGVLVDAGDLAGTRDALAACAGAVDDHNQVERWIVEGKLARAGGDVATALAVLGRAIDRSRAAGNGHDEARALLERAALAAGVGGATDDLRRAGAAATRTGSRGIAWTAHARLGVGLAATGDPTAAERELRRAGELLAQVLVDLSPRRQARYRATADRPALIAAIEAHAQLAPIVRVLETGQLPDVTDDIATVQVKIR
jgi:hypothetical protein